MAEDTKNRVVEETQNGPQEEQTKSQWPLETCRFCGKRMYALHQRPKINARTGQQYLETEHNCPDCDSWVTTKFPYSLVRTFSDVYLPTREEVESAKRS